MSHLTSLRLSFLSCKMCRITCLPGAVFKIKCVTLIVCLVFVCNCDSLLNILIHLIVTIIQWIKYIHYLSLPEYVQGTCKYSQLDFKMYCSAVSDSWQPHRLQPIRLLCPWDSPGKDTGVGCHFYSKGSSWPGDGVLGSCSPALQADSLSLSHWGGPVRFTKNVLEDSG